MINLDDIEARSKTATPWPWINDPLGDVITENGVQICDYIAYDANREFVAHARADVPALVAEVRRLQGELETARGSKPNCPSCGCQCAEVCAACR
jgi:hypothetical protein